MRLLLTIFAIAVIVIMVRRMIRSAIDEYHSGVEIIPPGKGRKRHRAVAANDDDD
jgi:hypothetical protein